jgi:hypothetical protein
MRVLVHCFLKWLRPFIGGLNTGADPRNNLTFINTFVNSQVISSIFMFQFAVFPYSSKQVY